MVSNKKALAAQKRLRRNFKRAGFPDWATRGPALDSNLVAWRKAANARRADRIKLAAYRELSQPAKKNFTRKYRRAFNKLRAAGFVAERVA